MISKEEALNALLQHVGASNGITAAALVAEITGGGEKNLALERQLRQAIADLRLTGSHICGHPSTGYFMATSADELATTCAFLRSRAMSSLVQESRLKNIALPELLGQMQLEMA